MEIRLDGVVALIAGATQGVDAAIAEMVARCAAGLPITGRDASPVDLDAPIIGAIVDQEQWVAGEVAKVTGRTP